MKALSIEQCFFNKWLPNNLRKFNSLWTLFRGVTLWAIWIERKNLVFNSTNWHDAKLGKVVWDGLLEYKRLQWQHTVKLIKRHPEDKERLDLTKCGVLTRLFACVH